PRSLKLYINGQLDGTVTNGSSEFKILGPSITSFYTDLNGGNANGSLSTQANFNAAFMWYYIVKNADSFNTGVEILAVGQTAANGKCETVECNEASCNTAFTAANAPTSFTTPTPPLNQCAKVGVVYNVTFCPGKFLPGNTPSSTTIHPDFDDTKCLDVQGAVYENGTPVQIFDCNGTGAQQWELTRGSTKVKVAGQNFCLDAGSTPANGVSMKIWECFDNLPAQQWFYTDDNRIALENQGQ
ncbi:G-X-X-X-Q-X-W domain-containing protein, partial [Gymnopilus junonius]